MNQFWKYFKEHQSVLFLLLLAATFSQVLSLAGPILFQWQMDNILTKVGELAQNSNKFWMYTLVSSLVGIILAFGARIAASFQQYFTSFITEKVSTSIYRKGIAKSLNLPFADFEDQSSGKTLGVINKLKEDVKKLISSGVSVLFSTLIGIVFVTIYTAFIDWRISVAFLVILPLLSVVSIALSKRIKAIQESIVKQTTDLSGSTTESLRNIEIVKSLGLVNQEKKRLAHVTSNLLELELDKVKKVRSLTFIQGTLVNFLRSLVFVLLVYLVWSGSISLGEFTAVQFFTFFIFNPLYEFGNLINTYRESQVSLENYEAILNKKNEPTVEGARPLSEIKTIAFKKVGFSHPNSKEVFAVQDITLKLESGKSVAFVGPSGAGKTTLIKLLVGLYRPQKGSIEYNSVDQSEVDIQDFRQHVGLVSQESYLFSGTIRENLLFVMPNASEEDMMQALKEASCQGILERAENGLDSTIGEQGLKLSGGEKQRLSIARALLRDPDVILFDEATSSLDSMTEAEIIETIKKLSTNKQRISVSIAHRLSTIMHVDTIYVLEKGMVVETGTHESLLEEKGLYYALWRQQIGEVV